MCVHLLVEKLNRSLVFSKKNGLRQREKRKSKSKTENRDKQAACRFAWEEVAVQIQNVRMQGLPRRDLMEGGEKNVLYDERENTLRTQDRSRCQGHLCSVSPSSPHPEARS